MMDDTYTGTRTVTAIFDTSAQAERAVERLRAAGVTDDQIRVTAGAGSSYSDTVDYNDATYRDQHRGFFDSLSDFFFPDEDRYAYAEGLARGAQLVTVTGFDPMLHERIADILDDEGSVDLDSRETEWRSSGWSGYEGSDYTRESGTASGIGTTLGRAADRAGDALARGADRVGDALTGDRSTRGGADYRDGGLQEDGTLKVVEERLNVGKREVEGGAVRVRSYVREVPVEAEVDLRATRVFLERRPVDRAVTPGDLELGDRTLEARESREEAVVSKDARVVEEIGLRKETEVQHERIQDTVRKTEVEIEDERTGERSRLSGDDTTGGSGRF